MRITYIGPLNFRNTIGAYIQFTKVAQNEVNQWDSIPKRLVCLYLVIDSNFQFKLPYSIIYSGAEIQNEKERARRRR